MSATHGNISCHETITYTTNGDFTFLDNLIPLLDRWQSPLSVALYAPGTDFETTLASILYLRNCHPDGEIVEKFASFHILFENKHMPKKIPIYDNQLEVSYVCPDVAPYENSSLSMMYKTKNKLLFPINLARNVAREAALTYFVLASDIELYPSRNMVDNFFEMIAANSNWTKGNK